MIRVVLIGLIVVMAVGCSSNRKAAGRLEVQTEVHRELAAEVLSRKVDTLLAEGVITIHQPEIVLQIDTLRQVVAQARQVTVEGSRSQVVHDEVLVAVRDSVQSSEDVVVEKTEEKRSAGWSRSVLLGIGFLLGIGVAIIAKKFL